MPNFDFSTILYVILGTVLLPMLKKIFPNISLPGTPTPVLPPVDPNAPPAPITPADSTGLVSMIVEAIFKMLMQRFLPVMERSIETKVYEAVANRPPVQEGTGPKVSQQPDGSLVIQLAK